MIPLTPGLVLLLNSALLHYMAHLLAPITLPGAVAVVVHEDGHFEWPVKCEGERGYVRTADYSPWAWTEAKYGVELVIDLCVSVGQFQPLLQLI